MGEDAVVNGVCRAVAAANIPATFCNGLSSDPRAYTQVIINIIKVDIGGRLHAPL